MSRRNSRKRENPCGIGWLLVAGLISSVAGLWFIVHPCPYVYMGAVEKGPHHPIVIADNNTPVVGLLILFMGAFILALAYRLKKS